MKATPDGLKVTSIDDRVDPVGEQDVHESAVRFEPQRGPAEPDVSRGPVVQNTARRSGRVGLNEPDRPAGARRGLRPQPLQRRRTERQAARFDQLGRDGDDVVERPEKARMPGHAAQRVRESSRQLIGIVLNDLDQAYVRS